jgi:hypothetical protein
MSTTQLLLDFTPITPPADPDEVPTDTSWCDVSEMAHGAGFRCPCLMSAELHNQLDDQALYDVLWTACFTLSLDRADCVLFTLELDGKPIRFKTLRTNHAAYLGRVEDL